MAASLRIGAEDALGYVLQPTFGSPVVVPSAAGSWVDISAKTLDFDAKQHMIETGVGSRATEQRAARGQSSSMGDFETRFYTGMQNNLIAYFLGADVVTGAGPYTHTMGPTLPRLLTIADIMGGQAYQYQDVLLDSLDLTSSADEFKIKYAIKGGIRTALGTAPVPTLATAQDPLLWGNITAASLHNAIDPGAMEAFTLSIKNDVGQVFGATGSFGPTRARGRKLTASGTYTIVFDTAAAAAAFARYVAGTEDTLVLTVGGHTITLPNARMTKFPQTWALADFVKVAVAFGVRAPNNLTWAVVNGDATAY